MTDETPDQDRDEMMLDFVEYEKTIHAALRSDEPIDAQTREIMVAYMGGLKFTICALMDICKGQIDDPEAPGKLLVDMLETARDQRTYSS